MSKRRDKTKRRAWDPLQRAVVSDPALYTANGMTVPDSVWRNSLYSVFVRKIGSDALHVSFHRHDRKAVRDWRHFQQIKNEVAGPERLALELFPPESMLIDTANEYHLWVWPTDVPAPFVMHEGLVMTHAEGVAQHGKTRARQRDWQPGLTTGQGRNT